MNQVIVSVKDTAAQAFGRPMFMPSNAVAVRGFRDEVNRVADDNQMNKHPSDFELYQLGDFDDSTGTIVPMVPSLISRAKDLLES